MKKICFSLIIVLLFAFASASFAASLITPSIIYGDPGKDSVVVIKLTCLAASDGTFDDYQIVDTISSVKYWQGKYYLGHAFAVNSATDYHTNAAVVTIKDSFTQQIVGTTVGDTLTLSQAASGVAYLVDGRSAVQRPVVGLLTISIADTGSTATLQTIYLVLIK